MFTTILLSVLLTLTLSVVVYLCVKLYKSRSDKLSHGEEITESMIRKMLNENNCTVIDVDQYSGWIKFKLDGRNFFIRVCGSYCEVHAGIRLDTSYNPAIVRYLCNNDMSHFTCGHIWYDEDNSGLLVTVFSIDKTYVHLKASFYDMIQCVIYMFNTFGELYDEKTNGREISNDNKVYS